MSSGWELAEKVSEEIRASGGKFVRLVGKKTPEKEFTIGVLGGGPKSRLPGSMEVEMKLWDRAEKKMHDYSEALKAKGFDLVGTFYLPWLQLGYGNMEAKTQIILPEPQRKILQLNQDGFTRLCDIVNDDGEDCVFRHWFQSEGNKKTYPFKALTKFEMSDELKKEVALFRIGKSEKYPWFNLAAEIGTSRNSSEDDDESNEAAHIEQAQYETLTNLMRTLGDESAVALVKKQFGVDKLKSIPKAKFDEAMTFIASLKKPPATNGVADFD